MPGIGDFLESPADTLNGGAGGEGAPTIDPKILQQITQRASQQTRDSLMAQLMQDPDIAAVFKAKTEKRRIKVIDDQPQPLDGGGAGPAGAGAGADDEPNFDEMSNKQLFGHMVKQMKPLMQGILKSTVEPLLAEINELKGKAAGYEQKTVNDAVNAFRSRTPDFDSYGEQILELSRQKPDLDVEELYALAKYKAGQFVPKANIAASEQPTFAVGSPTNRNPKSHSSSAIQDAVRKAMTNFVSQNPGEFLRG